MEGAAGGPLAGGGPGGASEETLKCEMSKRDIFIANDSEDTIKHRQSYKKSVISLYTEIIAITVLILHLHITNIWHYTCF